MLRRLVLVLACSLSFMYGARSQDQVLPQNMSNNTMLKYFALGEVQLLDGRFLKIKQQVHQYLLTWDMDRLLYWHRKAAGLPPKGEHYGGWDNGGSNILGHYLSAISYMYATTGDKQLLSRINYIVSELGLCQEAAKDGAIFNGPGDRQAFDRMRSGHFEFKVVGPEFPLVNGGNYFYGIHKNLAGLRDAYLYGHNTQARALLIRYVDWVKNFVDALPTEDFQAVLRAEHGGMTEVIADVYEITGEAKYATLAQQFVQRSVCDALAENKDILFPHHANAKLAQFVGYAHLFELLGPTATKEGTASFNFWQRVVNGHTLANGGNSEYERFGPSGEISRRIGFSSSETCNTYNMLKLSAQLFALSGDKKYYDYYERALYNSILASVNEDGMFCYYLSLKPGWFKTFSTPFNSNWCCVGTGMENPGKYEAHIYSHDASTLWINLYIPSEVKWKEQQFQLRQNGDLTASDTVSFTVLQSGKKTALRVRYPSWCSSGAAVYVNGARQQMNIKNGYILLGDNFRKGDVLKLIFPRQLRVERTPDNPYVAAFFYGPYLLAGKLGTQNMPPVPMEAAEPWDFNKVAEIKNIPVLQAEEKSIGQWITKNEGESLSFDLHVHDGRIIPMAPLYAITHERYSAYWDLFSPTEWEAYQQAKERGIKDHITFGDGSSEEQHELEAGKSTVGQLHFKSYRSVADSGWFACKLQNKGASGPRYLVVQCWGGGWTQDPQGLVDILVNGCKVATKDLGEMGHQTTFYNTSYEIPSSLLAGENEVSVTVQAKSGSLVGGIYKIALVTPDGLPLKELLAQP